MELIVSEPAPERTPPRVVVDAAALSALIDVAYRCVELHAQVQMDTPAAKAQHARAVEAMRESLAAARGALNIHEPDRASAADLLGSDPDYLGGQSVDDYIREARRDR
jgi:hypothetical protein